jgi:hypothetical protein
MVVALPVYFYFQGKTGFAGWGRDLKAAWWLIGYLPSMAVMSLIGSKQFGGSGLLPYGWDMAVVAVMSLLYYYWGVHTGYRSDYLDERESRDDILHEIGA